MFGIRFNRFPHYLISTGRVTDSVSCVYFALLGQVKVVAQGVAPARRESLLKADMEAQVQAAAEALADSNRVYRSW